MPPWLDSAEEAGALLGGVVGLLGALAVALIGAASAIYAAWRAKIKPLLTDTRTAAHTAAEQLTPNHGSSAHDSLARIERGLRELHADIRLDREQVGRRLERLESYHSAHSPIQENTGP